MKRVLCVALDTLWFHENNDFDERWMMLLLNDGTSLFL